MTTKQRQHLHEYSQYHRDIELTETAITILERTTQTRNVVSVIRRLKQEQQHHLNQLDKAAASLGAPYPHDA